MNFWKKIFKNSSFGALQENKARAQKSAMYILTLKITEKDKLQQGYVKRTSNSENTYS